MRKSGAKYMSSVCTIVVQLRGLCAAAARRVLGSVHNPSFFAQVTPRSTRLVSHKQRGFYAPVTRFVVPTIHMTNNNDNKVYISNY